MKADTGLLLPAGGRGLRLGAERPKQFLPLAGDRTALDLVLDAAQALERIAVIVLILPVEALEEGSRRLSRYSKLRLAEGGRERWESVRNGLAALPKGIDKVLVHDAARPFLPEAVVARCLEVLDEGEAVVAALPAVDTVKEVEGDFIVRTLPRARLVQVQTPQGFLRHQLEECYARLLNEPSFVRIVTDEAQMVEAAGYRVKWVPGDPDLRKITGPDDLEWARWKAATRDPALSGNPGRREEPGGSGPRANSGRYANPEGLEREGPGHV